MGISENKSIIDKLEVPIRGVMRRNFSSAFDHRMLLHVDSPSDVLIYASGRRNCSSLQGHIQLKSRQDLVSLANDFLADNEEKISFEIILDQNKAAGFVFGIVPKQKTKVVLQERFDISTFTNVLNTDKIDPKLAVFSESSEATNLVLSSGLSKYTNPNTGLITELFISDQPDKKPDELDFPRRKRLIASIKIPKLDESGIPQLVDNIEFVFYLIDYICQSVSLRPETLKKLEKSRSAAYKDLQRKEDLKKQEEAAKASALKRKIELESIERLPIEQRRKAEEKLAMKSEKRKNQKRVIMK
ncbi:UPF0674 endoplasmic reticulum membrane protein [Smittium mucronatum]|uniref:UPF0674 endoplasmic reticulum membrane protein n=1 Tax=Smittium mucronatum TaxID=133383 RepID=A0A1R0H3C5_9FUNG|nr:UPF0674 endoplasmic reticulum membrane protein [Smittium mucronatum]